MSDACFFFNDTATTEIYTLSLHDALPIFQEAEGRHRLEDRGPDGVVVDGRGHHGHERRSEEHTTELQSRQYLVCRLLLEKKEMDHQTSARLLVDVRAHLPELGFGQLDRLS